MLLKWLTGYFLTGSVPPRTTLMAVNTINVSQILFCFTQKLSYGQMPQESRMSFPWMSARAGCRSPGPSKVPLTGSLMSTASERLNRGHCGIGSARTFLIYIYLTTRNLLKGPLAIISIASSCLWYNTSFLIILQSHCPEISRHEPTSWPWLYSMLIGDGLRPQQ